MISHPVNSASQPRREVVALAIRWMSSFLFACTILVGFRITSAEAGFVSPAISSLEGLEGTAPQGGREFSQDIEMIEWLLASPFSIGAAPAQHEGSMNGGSSSNVTSSATNLAVLSEIAIGLRSNCIERIRSAGDVLLPSPTGLGLFRPPRV